MSTKIKNRRELFTAAKDYLDIKSIFPKSKIDGRKGLTDYQAKIVRRELNHLVGVAGGLHYLKSEAVKVRRTKSAKQYMKDAALPKSSKVVLLPGGAKVNHKVKIRDGVLFFERGANPATARASALFPLDAVTEKRMQKNIDRRADYINNPGNVTAIATASGEIKNVRASNGRIEFNVDATDADFDGDNSVERVKALAREIFNKYAALHKSGGIRANGRRAAHPSKWGLSLLIEAK